MGARAELLAYKCNRTQVRPVTNDEAEGIETVTSLLPNLTVAVREGRMRHFADITDEGGPEDDQPMVVEGDVMHVRFGRPDSQPDLKSSMHLPIPTPHHKVPDQKPTRNLRLKPRLQPALTWNLESMIAEFDFEKRERFSETPSGRILGPRVDGGTAWENTKTS